MDDNVFDPSLLLEGDLLNDEDEWSKLFNSSSNNVPSELLNELTSGNFHDAVRSHIDDTEQFIGDLPTARNDKHSIGDNNSENGRNETTKTTEISQINKRNLMLLKNLHNANTSKLMSVLQSPSGASSSQSRSKLGSLISALSNYSRRTSATQGNESAASRTDTDIVRVLEAVSDPIPRSPPSNISSNLAGKENVDGSVEDTTTNLLRNSSKDSMLMQTDTRHTPNNVNIVNSGNLRDRRNTKTHINLDTNHDGDGNSTEIDDALGSAHGDMLLLTPVTRHMLHSLDSTTASTSGENVPNFHPVVNLREDMRPDTLQIHPRPCPNDTITRSDIDTMPPPLKDPSCVSIHAGVDANQCEIDEFRHHQDGDKGDRVAYSIPPTPKDYTTPSEGNILPAQGESTDVQSSVLAHEEYTDNAENGNTRKKRRYRKSTKDLAHVDQDVYDADYFPQPQATFSYGDSVDVLYDNDHMEAPLPDASLGVTPRQHNVRVDGQSQSTTNAPAPYTYSNQASELVDPTAHDANQLSTDHPYGSNTVLYKDLYTCGSGDISNGEHIDDSGVTAAQHALYSLNGMSAQGFQSAMASLSQQGFHPQQYPVITAAVLDNAGYDSSGGGAFPQVSLPSLSAIVNTCSAGSTSGGDKGDIDAPPVVTSEQGSENSSASTMSEIASGASVINKQTSTDSALLNLYQYMIAFPPPVIPPDSVNLLSSATGSLLANRGDGPNQFTEDKDDKSTKQMAFCRNFVMYASNGCDLQSYLYTLDDDSIATNDNAASDTDPMEEVSVDSASRSRSVDGNTAVGMITSVFTVDQAVLCCNIPERRVRDLIRFFHTLCYISHVSTLATVGLFSRNSHSYMWD